MNVKSHPFVCIMYVITTPLHQLFRNAQCRFFTFRLTPKVTSWIQWIIGHVFRAVEHFINYRNSSWMQNSSLVLVCKDVCDSLYSAAVQSPCDIEAVAALHGSDSRLHDSGRAQHGQSGVCTREVAIPLEPCLETRTWMDRLHIIVWEGFMYRG